jgi:hypothetical protein
LHAAAYAARSCKCGAGLSPPTALKKLCNHPKLIYDMLASTTEGAADGFKDCAQYFPPVRAVASASFISAEAERKNAPVLCTGRL